MKKSVKENIEFLVICYVAAVTLILVFVSAYALGMNKSVTRLTNLVEEKDKEIVKLKEENQYLVWMSTDLLTYER